MTDESQTGDHQIDYEAVAQKLLDLEATSRAEGWADPEAINLVKQLNRSHGPWDLYEHYGQKSHWWEVDD